MNLESLVAIPSYESEGGMCGLVADFLAGHGVKTEIIKSKGGHYSLLAGGKGKIAFVSHGDTYGITNGWETDPLKLHIAGDKAYGLGSADMKGGLLAQLNAFLCLLDGGQEAKFAMLGDEEGISAGMVDAMGSGFFAGVEAAIFSEPSSISGAGEIACITKSPGRASFDIDIGFAASHPVEYKGNIQRVCEAIAKADGKWIVSSFLMHSDYMESPSKGKVQISRLGYDGKGECLRKLEKMLSPLKGQFAIKETKRKTPYAPPIMLEKGSKLHKVCSGLGLPVAESKVVFDMNYMAMLEVPAVNIGPVGGNLHSPNEWVSLSSIEKCEQYLVGICRSLQSV